MFGIICGPFIVGPFFGGLLAHDDWWARILFVLISSAMSCHYCFQSVELNSATMLIRRPFAPTQNVPLPLVTSVRTITKTGRGGATYHRFEFICGDEALGSFNPKLYSLQGIRCILEEVRIFSPATAFDKYAKWFLPHEHKKSPNRVAGGN